MIFNSYAFVLVFLPAVIIIYHLINSLEHYTASKVFLLAASILFYALNDIRALFILIIGIVFNYLTGLYLTRTSHSDTVRRIVLALGILINIGALIYFKYLGFFTGMINSLTGAKISIPDVIMPLGISYYTFSQISFITDCYKDPDTRYGFLDHALFVSFFPKISVGPIAFARDMVPKINESVRQKVNSDNMAKGIVFFAVGLAKKVLIADNLAPCVEWGFSNIQDLGSVNALIVMLSYTMQIYYDFSGYCDMAGAVCLMMNIDLPDNFNSPYRAVSIADFWKRWHMTLTAFFTKYVYIPLGGNRKGRVRTYVNMFVVFFLSGLWHGASYSFIVWGLIHGVGITLSKLLSDGMSRLPCAVRRFGTFVFVNIAWVFFRAPTLGEAVDFLKQLFSFRISAPNIELIAAGTPDEMQFLQWMILTGFNRTPYLSGCIILLGLLAVSVFISMYCRNCSQRKAVLKFNPRTAATTVILLTLSVLSLSRVSEFIYTNF